MSSSSSFHSKSYGIFPINCTMDMSWENWFSDLDVDEADFIDESSINHNCSFDDDDHEEFLKEILHDQPCLSSDEIETSTLQNNNVVAAAPTNANFDDSGSHQFHNDSILSELATCLSGKPDTLPSPPSSYILSFNNSTVLPAASMDDDYMKHESAAKSSNNKEQYSESSNVRGGGSLVSLKRSLKNPNGDMMPKQGGTKKARRSSETLDHIMAERRRRQEITEKFIALSATIPGLKKIDKSSILSEAINYVKRLQERVRELEEQNKKISEQSSMSCRKKSYHLKAEDHHHHKDNTLNSNCEMMSSDEDEYCFRSSSNNNEAISQVEARLLKKEILIRIQCERQKSIMLNIFTLLTNLHFSIISTGVLPFGTSSLDITIIAEVGDQCKIPVKEVVNKLRVALLRSSENKK